MSIFENPLIRTSQLERRQYQINIAEAATKQNVLAVLPTGLGKTEIAVLAAAYFLLNHWDKKVLVMAPTRPLVAQHYERFLRLLRIRPERARVLTGEVEAAQRMREWMDPGIKLYFATPQTAWLDHERGLRFSDFSFMVFDECHRSRSRYAYTKIAEAYVNECTHPIILGMTASPGATRERIEEICKALWIERIEARTEDDPDVRPYVHPVELEWRRVELPEEYRELCGTLERMEGARVKRLKEMGLSPSAASRKHLLELQRRLATEARSNGSLWPAALLAAEAVQLSYLRELLGNQGKEAALAFLARMRASGKRSHRALLKELDSAGFEAKLRSLGEHPKMRVLKEVISAQVEGSPGSRILIFNQYRDNIEHLVSRLRGEGIGVERFVGQADRARSEGMSQEEQLRALERLRGGELQALVMSSVGEEGLDVPSADLVIFYEPVPSEIRFIQRKGRTGRVRVGRAVVLVAEGTADQAYMWISLRRAKRMRDAVAKLQARLQQLLRGPPPQPSALPPEEMAPEGVDELRPPEEARKEQTKRFRRELARNAELVLREILLFPGLSVEQASEKLGISRPEVEAVVERLAEENLVARIGENLWPAGPRQGSRHTFEVEKVLEGKAILRVDEKWYAVLDAEDFSGPRFVLKSGCRFEALSELFHKDGEFHVKIFSVTRIFEP